MFIFILHLISLNVWYERVVKYGVLLKEIYHRSVFIQLGLFTNWPGIL